MTEKEEKQLIEFTKAAMQGILGGHGPYDIEPKEVGKKAVEYATATLKALSDKLDDIGRF